jgi:hypothetical protein
MRYVLIVLGFLSIMVACRKNKTVWDTNWNVPLVNDSLTLQKWVNDSTLEVSTAGYYEVNLHRTLLDVDLASIVHIPDTTINKTFGISFSSWTFPPNSNFVNSVEEHTLQLPEVELKKVRLLKGFVDLKLQNPVGTKVIFTVKLPGVSKNGVDFQQTYTAPSGSVSNPGIVEGTVDLSGYYMDLRGTNGAGFNLLQSQFIVKTDPTGPSIDMTSQDITKIAATFRAVQIDYARGYFGNRIISDTAETTLQFLSKITAGSIDFPASSLKVSVVNGSKLPAQGKLHFISNENQTGNVVSLTTGGQGSFQFGQAFPVDPATGSWSSLTASTKIIAFNAVNSNLEQYLENFGAKQKIAYSLHLNPWGNTSGGWNEIFPESRLKVTIDAALPLALGLDGLTIQDTFDFDVKQDTKKTHVVSGDLVLTATNGFPMSGELVLNLLDKEGGILHTVSGSGSLRSSLLGNGIANNGIPTSFSTVRFILSKEMILDLDRAKKVVVTARFSTPDPSTGINGQVLIPEGAFLGFKVKGAFKLENKY